MFIKYLYCHNLVQRINKNYKWFDLSQLKKVDTKALLRCAHLWCVWCMIKGKMYCAPKARQRDCGNNSIQKTRYARPRRGKKIEMPTDTSSQPEQASGIPWQLSTPPSTLLRGETTRLPEKPPSRGGRGQYAPWSLLSVGESSCRRKNLTSCFRGPHFCRCSYIMCSKGIARSAETEKLKERGTEWSVRPICQCAKWKRCVFSCMHNEQKDERIKISLS